MKLLAVIPAYNEEACLAQTVANLRSVCPECDYVVINDGSRDATAEICRQNNLNFLNLPINTGLTSAFRAGMKYAEQHGYDAVVQFDADGQHLPEYIQPMANALIEKNADIVIASRILAGESPKGARKVGSSLISALIKLTTGTVITDPTSGMRMFNRSLIEQFAHSYDMAPEPDMLAVIARKGGTIIEVGAKMQDRQGGESYLNLPKIITYMLRTCGSIILFQWLR